MKNVRKLDPDHDLHNGVGHAAPSLPVAHGGVQASAGTPPGTASPPVASDGADVLFGMLAPHGFTMDQARYLFLNRIVGVTQREIALELGWTRQKAEAVRKALDRAIPKVRRSMILMEPEREMAGAELATGTATSMGLPMAPGPRIGQRIQIWFAIESVSNSNRVCPQSAKGKRSLIGRRKSLTGRSQIRRYFVLTVEVTQDQIKAEVAAMGEVQWQDAGYSSGYVADLAKDRVTRRLSQANEDAERQRIENRSLADVQTLVDASSTRLIELTPQLVEKKALLGKLRRDRNLEGVDGLRGIFDFITKSEIPQTEDQLTKLQQEYRAVSWTHTTASEVLAYKLRLADERVTRAAEKKDGPRIHAGINELSGMVTPLMGAGADTKLFADENDLRKRVLLLNVVRALAALHAYEKEKK
jgi:hypothetical protein